MQFLAILRVEPDAPREKLGPQLRPEAAAAWEMLSAGAIRSIHYVQGERGPIGAALMLEAADRAEAEALVNRLPLVAHGLARVEVLSLMPFTGFSALFAPPAS